MKASGRLASAHPVPSAEARSHVTIWHGEALDDPWHWLRDAAYPALEDADVRAYLDAENAYFDAVMGSQGGVVDALTAEIRGRQQEDEASVPWHDGAWTWRWYFEAGAAYRRWGRRPRAGGEEICVLDENRLAEGHAYFRLGALETDRSGPISLTARTRMVPSALPFASVISKQARSCRTNSRDAGRSRGCRAKTDSSTRWSMSSGAPSKCAFIAWNAPVKI